MRYRNILTEGNLEITTKIGCSNMCEYCPQLLLIKKYKEKKGKEVSNLKSFKFLTLENFKKFIKTIPREIDFHFTGYVEPFDNPECHNLLIESQRQGHILSMNTTLEGLTIEKYKKIKNLHYKDFRIHMPSATYFEYIGVKIPVKKRDSGQKELKQSWLDTLEYIIKNPPNIINFHSHGGCHEQALDLVEKMVNEGFVSREKLDVLKLPSRENSRSQNKEKSGNVKRAKIPEKYNIRGKCHRIFQSVLLPDGRLALCCQDYGLEHVVGNLSKQTWQEFRSSNSFKELINSGANLCDYCDRGVPKNTYLGEE